MKTASANLGNEEQKAIFLVYFSIGVDRVRDLNLRTRLGTKVKLRVWKIGSIELSISRPVLVSTHSLRSNLHKTFF